MCVVIHSIRAIINFSIDIKKRISMDLNLHCPTFESMVKKTVLFVSNKDAVTVSFQELKSLQQKKVEYQQNGNESQALKVEAEITKKTDYLREYTNAKNVELESMLKSLETSDEFYKKLYDTLEKIAESGGYSMILSLQASNSILWYSNSVDITDQVIQKLGL